MLREVKLKECLKEMIVMLEQIQDSKLSNSNDTVKNLRAMSVRIAKIEKTKKLSYLFFLARILNYVVFEQKVLNPTKRYFERFGSKSDIWHKSLYFDSEIAKTMFFEGKSELNIIISNMKSNIYFY